MYIENERGGPRRWSPPELTNDEELADEADAVEFDDKGRARVTRDVGESLAEHYDAISIVQREGEAADDAVDADAETDDETDA